MQILIIIYKMEIRKKYKGKNGKYRGKYGKEFL